MPPLVEQHKKVMNTKRKQLQPKISQQQQENYRIQRIEDKLQQEYQQLEPLNIPYPPQHPAFPPRPPRQQPQAQPQFQPQTQQQQQNIECEVTDLNPQL